MVVKLNAGCRLPTIIPWYPSQHPEITNLALLGCELLAIYWMVAYDPQPFMVGIYPGLVGYPHCYDPNRSTVGDPARATVINVAMPSRIS